MLDRAKASFLGPLSVSVLLDSSGANTTASAAVRVVASHMELENAAVLARIMLDLNRNGITILLVTHDPEMAQIANRQLRPACWLQVVPI